MSGWRSGIAFAGVLGLGVGARAQMHKVAKPETVVRAVGVYEWTGELGHPTASRLIPVSLFIDGSLEDAGVYLARPVPFALNPGTEYELDAAGLPKGDLALESTARVQTPDDAYTDGWIGYGSFRLATGATGAAGAAAKGRPARVSGSMDVAETNGAKSKAAGDAGSAPAGDPDRPVMKRRDGGVSGGNAPAGTGTGTAGTGTGTGTSTGGSAGTDGAGGGAGTPAAGTGGTGTGGTGTGGTGGAGEDEHRPTMRRRDSGDAAGGSGTGAASGGGTDTSADDPADRPTLKRRTPAQADEAKKEKKRKGQTASVTGVGSLNDDPDRPTLHRGNAAGAEGADREVPKLVGTPPDLRQMVAVSDAAKRGEHPFARAWEGEEERLAVLRTMRGMAAAGMAGYVGKSGAGTGKGGAGSGSGAAGSGTAGSAAAGSAAAGSARTGSAQAGSGAAGAAKAGAGTSVARRRAAAAKTAAAAKLVPAFQDEDVRGYLLSYGGAPTYVYQGHTAGTGDGLRYATVVAQVGAGGELRQVMTTVTDAAHLDRTPWMRLVDAVDAEASNRASLLFELRGQTSRQFALYRVLGTRADQTFLTGTTQ